MGDFLSPSTDETSQSTTNQQVGAQGGATGSQTAVGGTQSAGTGAVGSISLSGGAGGSHFITATGANENISVETADPEALSLAATALGDITTVAGESDELSAFDTASTQSTAASIVGASVSPVDSSGLGVTSGAPQPDDVSGWNLSTIATVVGIIAAIVVILHTSKR